MDLDALRVLVLKMQAHRRYVKVPLGSPCREEDAFRWRLMDHDILRARVPVFWVMEWTRVWAHRRRVEVTPEYLDRGEYAFRCRLIDPETPRASALGLRVTRWALVWAH